MGFTSRALGPLSTMDGLLNTIQYPIIQSFQGCTLSGVLPSCKMLKNGRKKIPTKGSLKKTHLETHRNKETQKVKTPKKPKGNKPTRQKERGKGVHGINDNKKKKRKKEKKETGERKKLPELGRELRELSTLERAFSRQLPIVKEKGKKQRESNKRTKKTLSENSQRSWNGSSFYRRFSRSSSSI